jgi:hypothetical protein
MAFKKKWTKEFIESLTEEEKTSFSLWLAFSEKKISEPEFKKKMDIQVMPRLLGKMSAARINALENEVVYLHKKIDALEKKFRLRSK